MSWLFKQFQPDSQNDIALLSETIGRQLRGVADFLAPPPPTTTTAETSSEEESSSQAIVGIRNDLAEITGSFKSSLSLISSNKAVSGISNFASNLLKLNDDDIEEEGVAGIVEEVVEFVRKIAKRPELWTEFPLQLDNDFHMSDAQKEHASTIEYLVPEFSSLRAQLDSISDERFWLIYFILLLPRLDEEDLELLLSPKIVDTRDILLQKLRNKEALQTDNSENALDASQKDAEVSIMLKDESPFHGGDLLEKKNAANSTEEDDEDTADKCLKDADDVTPAPPNAQNRLENDEDVSFSDLEDDDNDLSARLAELRHRQDSRPSSSSESNEWVQLNSSSNKDQGCSVKAKRWISREKYSSGEDSSGWLAVDEF